MKPVIYLDMDGVCCNFAKAAIEAHGRDYERILRGWPSGVYGTYNVLGMTKQEFWNGIDKIGAKFWRELEEYSYFKELYGSLKDLAAEFGAEEVHFATTPSDHPSCAAGKIMWLQDRFGLDFNKYIIIHDKHILARPGAILIDDSEDKCNAFLEAGSFYGQGSAFVLVPQAHNKAQPIEADHIVEQIVRDVRLWLQHFTAEVT